MAVLRTPMSASDDQFGTPAEVIMVGFETPCAAVTVEPALTVEPTLTEVATPFGALALGGASGVSALGGRAAERFSAAGRAGRVWDVVVTPPAVGSSSSNGGSLEGTGARYGVRPDRRRGPGATSGPGGGAAVIGRVWLSATGDNAVGAVDATAAVMVNAPFRDGVARAVALAR